MSLLIKQKFLVSQTLINTQITEFYVLRILQFDNTNSHQ